MTHFDNLSTKNQIKFNKTKLRDTEKQRNYTEFKAILSERLISEKNRN